MPSQKRQRSGTGSAVCFVSSRLALQEPLWCRVTTFQHKHRTYWLWNVLKRPFLKLHRKREQGPLKRSRLSFFVESNAVCLAVQLMASKCAQYFFLALGRSVSRLTLSGWLLPRMWLPQLCPCCLPSQGEHSRGPALQLTDFKGRCAANATLLQIPLWK